VYGIELKNIMKRFIQHIKKIGLNVSMTIFLVGRRIVTGSICLELAKIISIVFVYGNGQSTVHDIFGKEWWLS
jgi:hypothetical protein